MVVFELLQRFWVEEILRKLVDASFRVYFCVNLDCIKGEERGVRQEFDGINFLQVKNIFMKFNSSNHEFKTIRAKIDTCH